MSKNRTKTTAKRKRSVTAKQKDPVQRRDAVLKSYDGHWTVWIKPSGAALLSETLGRVLFFLKNHGPGEVFLMAEQGDLMDLPAGNARATYAHGTVRVENRTESPALIEFDFLPLSMKN
jgi:hypothetical protein